MVSRLARYEARTLGGGTDYHLEKDTDGPLCRDVDVEALEAAIEPLRKVVEAAESTVEFCKDKGLAYSKRLEQLLPAALEALEEVDSDGE